MSSWATARVAGSRFAMWGSYKLAEERHDAGATWRGSALSLASRHAGSLFWIWVVRRTRAAGRHHHGRPSHGRGSDMVGGDRAHLWPLPACRDDTDRRARDGGPDGSGRGQSSVSSMHGSPAQSGHQGRVALASTPTADRDA